MAAKTALSAMQKKFVAEYLAEPHLNATQAAKNAGYSEKTANEQSHKMMAMPKIQEAIQSAMKAREQRTLITQDKVLAELAKIGFADIKQYLQYKTAKTVVRYDDDGEPIVDYQQIVDVIDSSEVDGSVIQEISIGKDGTFKFKLHDKMSALDKIGKHLGMFVEKHEVTGKDGGPLEFANLTTEELQRKARELLGDK